MADFLTVEQRHKAFHVCRLLEDILAKEPDLNESGMVNRLHGKGIDIDLSGMRAALALGAISKPKEQGLGLMAAAKHIGIPQADFKRWTNGEEGTVVPDGFPQPHSINGFYDFLDLQAIIDWRKANGSAS